MHSCHTVYQPDLTVQALCGAPRPCNITTVPKWVECEACKEMLGVKG